MGGEATPFWLRAADLVVLLFTTRRETQERERVGGKGR